MNTEITHADVERYLYSLLPARDAVLEEMEAYACEHRIPIVGPAVGRLLYLLVKLVGARRIFEMGSAIGYSTVWLARATGEGSEVYYSNGSKGNARRASQYLERAGVGHIARIAVGDSLELLRATPGEFDLIFNDVDKHQYPEVFPLALSRLRRGGLLVADNALWFGRVARQLRPDRDTRGIQEFNRLTYSTAELHTIVIPLRDGVSISLKL